MDPGPVNRAERGLPSAPLLLLLALREGRSHIYVASSVMWRSDPDGVTTARQLCTGSAGSGAVPTGPNRIRQRIASQVRS